MDLNETPKNERGDGSSGSQQVRGWDVMKDMERMGWKGKDRDGMEGTDRDGIGMGLGWDRNGIGMG